LTDDYRLASDSIANGVLGEDLTALAQASEAIKRRGISYGLIPVPRLSHRGANPAANPHPTQSYWVRFVKSGVLSTGIRFFFFNQWVVERRFYF
jgi:hypothetical protein